MNFNFMSAFKAPYTLIVVLMATVAACYMMINPHLGVEKAAFSFTAVLVGGFGTKALLAVMIRALNTAVIMMACTLVLLLVAITATHAEIFKDAAVEGVANGVAGSIIVVVGALLERHRMDGSNS